MTGMINMIEYLLQLVVSDSVSEKKSKKISYIYIADFDTCLQFLNSIYIHIYDTAPQLHVLPIVPTD